MPIINIMLGTAIALMFLFIIGDDSASEVKHKNYTVAFVALLVFTVFANIVA